MFSDRFRLASWFSSALLGIAAGSVGGPSAAQEREARGEPLEEIVVTAQKRTETIQRVPAAISVVTPDQISSAGITDVRQVNALVPGVRFGKQQSVAQMFIRGVGIGSDNPNLDTAVAMVVNGITQPREGTGASLFDLERIEILKGAQGTIYGTNAIGGVVNVIAARPSPDFGGYAFAEFGNYSRVHLSAAQDLPLGDKVRVRAAINMLERDGYASTELDDEDSVAGRLSVAYQPTDAVDLLVWAQVYRAQGLGDQGYPTPPRSESEPWEIGPIVTNSPRIDEDRDIEINQGGIQLDWSLPNDLVLSYVPGYYYSEQEGHLLIDTGVPFGSLQSVFNTRKQHTQELRVANTDDGRLQWLAGLYYWRLDTEEYREFFVGGAQLINYSIPQILNESFAAFAQATYGVTDRTRLTIGARAARDDKSGFGNTFGPPPAYAVPPTRVFSADLSWDHVDWKVGVEHDLTPNSMLYAAVQTGFLGGAFQNFPDGLNGQSNELQPEELVGFTVGSKNVLQDGRVTLNAEAYYYDYQDYQVGLINLAAGTNAFFNAPESEIYGLDVQAQFAPTDAARLVLNLSALHGEFTDFFVPQGVSSPVRAYDFNGFALPHAPEFVASLSYEHTFRFSNGARLIPSITSQFSSGHWGNFAHGITRCAGVPPATLSQEACVDPGLKQDSYTVTNVLLTFSAASDRWDLSVFGRNLEDDNVLTSGGDAGSPAARAATTWAPPRTYGAQLNVRW